MRELLSYNIPIYFEKENLDTGSMESELILAILSSMAQGESESISENVKWSNQKNIKRHKNNGESDRYYAEEHHEAIISKSEFEKVQELIQIHADERKIIKS